MAADRRFTEPRRFGSSAPLAKATIKGTSVNWGLDEEETEDKKSSQIYDRLGRVASTNSSALSPNDLSRFQEEFRPPYAPELSQEEMSLLARFLNKKEKRLAKLREDKFFKFVTFVAGSSNRSIDDLLQFDTKDRYLPFNGTKLPSAKFTADVTANRQAINAQIVERMRALDRAKLEMLLQAQIQKTSALLDLEIKVPTTPENIALTVKSIPIIGRLVSVEEGSESALFDEFPAFAPEFNKYQIRAREFQDVLDFYRAHWGYIYVLFSDVPNLLELSEKDEAELLQLMSVMGIRASITAEETTTYQAGVVTDDNETRKGIYVSRLFEAFSNQDYIRDSDAYKTIIENKETDDNTRSLEFLFPIVAYPALDFDDLFATTENTPKTERYLTEKRMLEDFLKQESLLDHSSDRQRMYASLQWLGRPEVLGSSNMSESLSSAIDLALTQIHMFCPSLSNLDSIAQVLNCENQDFVTLFAELVAKIIISFEVGAPSRVYLEIEAGRKRQLIRKLLYAFRKFSFDGKRVTSTSGNGRSCGSYNTALYAFP